MLSETIIADRLTALAHESRLKVFRLIVRHTPTGIAAGAIARTLGLPANTLSAQLSALKTAELVRVEQQGRQRIYHANLDVIDATLGFLIEECCEGRLERCGALGAGPRCPS